MTAETNYSGKQVQILEAAERLFAERGFDGTSVRDIAAEAGVNLAMISYYFGSKEGLLSALFTHRVSVMGMRIETALEDDSLTPLQKMEQLAEAYVERMMRSMAFHKIIIREQVSPKFNTVNAALLEAKKRNHELLKRLIQQGQKSGEFRKGVDVPLTMATIIGTINHFLTSLPFYRETVGMQEATDAAFEEHVRKKLTAHLKNLVKSLLTHEA